MTTKTDGDKGTQFLSANQLVQESKKRLIVALSVMV